MHDQWKAFWLGLFTFVALGLAAWLILFIKPSVGDGKLKLTVMFSNVEKVADGTLVTFAGRQVGEVKAINTISDPRKAPADAFGNLYIYVLTLAVDSSVKVYLYDEIIFSTAGLLGEKSIAIIPKAPPPGAPPPYEVTRETLYARSTDRLEQTLNKFVDVAGTFSNTLEVVNHFIQTNNKEFNTTLKTLSGAAQSFQDFVEDCNQKEILIKTVGAITQAGEFFTMAQESRFLNRFEESLEAFNEVAYLFSRGEGTIARLVNSDSFYVQLTTVVCQLRTVLHDIQNYGLLYQFDRKWQRLQDVRRSCTEIPAPAYCE